MANDDKDQPETPRAVGASIKASPWTLSPRPTGIPSELDPICHLLEQYSGIPPEDVDSLLLQTKDKAYAIFPYGMITSFHFLNLTHPIQDPLFQSVVTRLSSPTSTETFLDVGCCLGHLPRCLISAHNIPGHRLYGTDLHQGFLDLGHEVFRDGDKNKGGPTFIAADFLNEKDHELDALNGKIDIIYASAFFHLFEREDQLKAARRMARLLRRENPNAVIFGMNGGVKVEGWEGYVLGEDSWRDMWDQVGEETGRKWRVERDFEEGVDWIKVGFGVYPVDVDGDVDGV